MINISTTRLSTRLVAFVTQLEGWRLFNAVVLMMSIIMIITTIITGIETEQQLRSLIRQSVRYAWPILIVVFVTSPALRLWPGDFTKWLMKNRKYLGLAYAAAMIWQILYIVLLIRTGVPLFTFGPVKFFLISDLIGYVLLFAMALTSFKIVRRHMNKNSWKILHKTGLFYIFTIYFYTSILAPIFIEDPVSRLIYVTMLIVNTSTIGLRILAWRKQFYEKNK